VLVILAAIRGYWIGFGRTVLPTLGLLTGLLGAAWAIPHVVSRFANLNDKVFISLALAIFLASIGFMIGELIGQRLNTLSFKFHLEKLNAVLGALFESVVMLVAVWLLASLLANVQAYDIGRQLQSSYIVRQLNSILPAPPDVLSRIEKLVSPNGFPNVFIGNQPERALIQSGQKLSEAQIAAAEQSVVQIAGFGCGGLVEGSGFVIGGNAVVTNAHVVAGVSRPLVLDSGERFATRLIYFDPRQDLAILHVEGLDAPALAFERTVLPESTATAVLGYPEGGPLTAGDAVILGQTRALGQDIYGRSAVTRSIYEVAAVVEPGNSGGPLITADGHVAGIIFAKSVLQDNVGYALTAGSVADRIEQAVQKNQTVPAGRCTAN